jgi:hypothetical protein
MYPQCRASLDDLTAQRFSSDGRKRVFELLMSHRGRDGDAIATKDEEIASYIQKLLLVSEEEYPDPDEISLQQEAFFLARKIFLESNREFKNELNLAVREAEKQGDEELRKQLMNKLSAIIDAER